MSQFLQMLSRVVPSSLLQQYDEKIFTRLFELIDSNQSVEQIMESGIVAKGQMPTLLLQLMTEKLIAPAGQAQAKRSILLVTDSASDLPTRIIEAHNIAVVPLRVNIDGQEFRDGVDISTSEFYRLLRNTKSFPSTSPPTVDDFHELFLKHIADYDILGLFISKKMSQTCDIARQAVMNNFNSYLKKRSANPTMNKHFKIEIIDSSQVSMGAALLVMEAAEKIQLGWSLDDIKKHIVKLSSEVKVFFMVDNLNYLARGGRIGHGSALLGNLFGFKPILGMASGGVNAETRSFGGKRGQRKLIDYMKKDLITPSAPIRIGICHASAPEKATTVSNLIYESFPDKEQVVSDFGPTVGAHLGPGAVGVAWLSVPE